LKNRTNNIFCWINEITLHKTPAQEFTDKDWEIFNPWLVHRFISMNLYYIELANYAQTLMPTNKKEIYNFYREMVPKRKVFLKYIKSKNKSASTELIEKISSYFRVGKAEGSSYIDIMNNEDILSLLRDMGIEKKEAKKLMK
tara:strand:+ start:134 stop:559 length:426 start_codon:yes stop_codon:yes gene_type:complete